MNLVAIRHEIGVALAGIGFVVYDHVPDGIELPCAFPGFPDPIDYHPAAGTATYAGGVEIEVPLLLAVDRSESQWAQMRLAAACSTVDTRDTLEGILSVPEDVDRLWLGPVKPTLEAHSTDAWQSIRIRNGGGYGTTELAGVKVLAYELIAVIVAI